MPSRASLILRARPVNVDYTTYPNDSKLEQAVIYAEKTNVGDSVQATQTLTSNATNVSANDTVTIGGLVYTFVAVPTLAFHVDIGADAAGSLDNLKVAINAGAGAGTAYGTGTYAHPTVTATTNTDTTQVVQAIDGGTEGNAIGTTEAAATLSWGAVTLASGADGTYYESEDAVAQAQESGGANV